MQWLEVGLIVIVTVTAEVCLTVFLLTFGKHYFCSERRLGIQLSTELQ